MRKNEERFKYLVFRLRKGKIVKLNVKIVIHRLKEERLFWGQSCIGLWWNSKTRMLEQRIETRIHLSQSKVHLNTLKCCALSGNFPNATTTPKLGSQNILSTLKHYKLGTSLFSGFVQSERCLLSWQQLLWVGQVVMRGCLIIFFASHWYFSCILGF